MRYKCESCGHEFEEDEMITVQECVGEFWGVPAYESWGACPRCKSTDIYEVEEDEEDEEDD